MKFGVREIANVVFKATANGKIGSMDVVAGQPVLYIESAKTSTLEGAATTVYEGADTQFTDVLSGAGTFTYTVKAVFTTPDEYKKKNPASSKAGDVIVESAPSPTTSETAPVRAAFALVVASAAAVCSAAVCAAVLAVSIAD